MKPFTLEWWLNLRSIVSYSVEYWKQRHNHVKSRYYRDFEEWIDKRIITKYGENETT